MSHLSRRDFLKCAGISLLGGALAALPSVFSLPDHASLYGRALTAVPVYPSPSARSAAVAHLWPDSIVRVLDDTDEWYRLGNGYAKRETLQPVLLSTNNTPIPTLPYWAEVGSAVAVVRQWCAADAPLVARIGHGGVAQVVDVLPGHSADWVGLADGHELFGWSQIKPWRAVHETKEDAAAVHVQIDTHTWQLEVIQNDNAVLRAPITFNAPPTHGTYTIQQRQPSVKSRVDAASDGYGTPWQMGFGDYALAGVYWHNHFGKPIHSSGPTVQVTPAAARWLYHHLPDGTLVTIV